MINFPASIRFVLSTTLIALGIAGCSAHAAPRPTAPLAPASAIITAPAPAPTPVPSQESLLEYVPATAVAAVVVRRGALAPLREWLDGDESLRNDLGRYFDQYIGADFSRVEGLVAFSTHLSPNPTGALFVRLPAGAVPGELKRPKAGDIAGVTLYRVGTGARAAVLPNGIWLGDESEVRAAIAVAM